MNRVIISFSTAENVRIIQEQEQHLRRNGRTSGTIFTAQTTFLRLLKVVNSAESSIRFTISHKTNFMKHSWGT